MGDLSTGQSSAQGLLHALFFQFAPSQADKLGPDCQHGLSEGQVLHTEGDSGQLGGRTRKCQHFVPSGRCFN